MLFHLSPSRATVWLACNSLAPTVRCINCSTTRTMACLLESPQTGPIAHVPEDRSRPATGGKEILSITKYIRMETDPKWGLVATGSQGNRRAPLVRSYSYATCRVQVELYHPIEVRAVTCYAGMIRARPLVLLVLCHARLPTCSRLQLDLGVSTRKGCLPS